MLSVVDAACCRNRPKPTAPRRLTSAWPYVVPGLPLGTESAQPYPRTKSTAAPYANTTSAWYSGPKQRHYLADLVPFG
jgi:hypothetical protein